MTSMERVVPGWGDSHSDHRRVSQAVGREPDQFIASNINEKPAVDLLNALIVEAVRIGASDIHLEAREDGVQARFRLDGSLSDIRLIDSFVGRVIENKIREKAKLTVNERNSALDSRMSFRIEGRPVDMRVSILPMRNGSSIVCRILDQAGATRRLKDIVMSNAVAANFQEILDKPDGLFLMTGPTGSGKTSTLYAALNEVNTRDRKLLTIEDPVEYRLEGACQVEVTRDLTFAQALRSSLRQDPDVILVGEIRDSETAKTALQAAMTGHLVFSTIHANSAATTLIRLTDLGTDPFTLGASIRGVVAQRLAPRICSHCKHPATLTASEKSWLARRGVAESVVFYEADGCEKCEGRGVSGRIPVMEMIVKSDALRHAIESGLVTEIEKAAREQPQFETLEECALRIAVEGSITLASARFIGGT